MDIISAYIRPPVAGLSVEACTIGLMPTQPALPRHILTAALTGLEAQKKAIDEHIAAVRSMLGTKPKRLGRPPQQVQYSEAQTAVPRKRRRMSAEGRRRIAEAARKRWAAAKKAGRTKLG